MGFLLDRSYPASFGGAEFFYISGTVSAGRKIILHEYPNKTFRKPEDLGDNLRTFNISAKISGPFYEDNKIRLEDALKKEGTQVLVHPTLGNINCVCTGFSVSESLSAYGVATYNLNFAEVSEGDAPSPEGSNIGVIASLYRDLYDFVKDDLNGQYVANFVRNISFAAQKLSELSDSMRGIRGTIGALSQSGSEFINQLSNFDRNIFKIASPDGDIGGNISTVVGSFDSLSDDGQTRFDASSQLIGFGALDNLTTLPTKEINERNSNQKLINGTINSLAFVNMVDGAKSIDFQDELQLNEAVEVLDNKYDELINSSTNKFSNELLDKINEIRNQARIFFEDARLTVNKVIEIETKPTPVAVLTYQYYGNTDDYDQLLSLNQSFNPAIIEGTVQILES